MNGPRMLPRPPMMMQTKKNRLSSKWKVSGVM
jgi:hypothetical protein